MKDMMKYFFKVHDGLPQEGPGSKDSTLKALSYINLTAASAKILDIGCGPGRQTVILAKATEGHVTAVDNYGPFLHEINERAKAANISGQIKTINCSMDDLKLELSSFDIIWSEGALYIMGFQKGLNYLKKFLKPGGYMAVSEAVWLRNDPPKELLDFWMKEYPAMKTVNEDLEIIKKCGLKTVAHFHLPDSDWWNYYNPILAKIDALKITYKSDKNMDRVIAMEEKEIGMFKKYSSYYGYEFFIMNL